MTKTRDLLQYPVEDNDLALICVFGKNHGRVCEVLRKWEGEPLMSNDFAHLKEKDCFVVMSLGSPFVYEVPGEDVYYAIHKTHLLVVETNKLKRVARSNDLDYSYWKKRGLT